MITAEVLRLTMPFASMRAVREFTEPLEAARQRFVGDDWREVAMWLAQIAHESGSLAFVREVASGDAYEGRADLGNTKLGWGRKYKGRGLLQITGRYNYEKCGEALGLPLADHPELLELADNAAMSAGWFWRENKVGDLCRRKDPVLAVTKRINGGTNGLEARRRLYINAIAALKVGEDPSLRIA